MSESWAVQASYKFGTNQQSMLNIRAADSDELKIHLSTIADGDVVTALTHLDLTLQAGAALAPVTSAAAPAPVVPLHAVPPQAAPQQQGYQQTPAPVCPHGTRKFVTGAGQKGPWAAYFCPVAKGTPGACAPDWQKA